MNTIIEESFAQALYGDREALVAFFQGFLNGPLYVPERFQSAPLSDAPVYPNDFVIVLGVKDKDRAIVPAFTREDFIADWFGSSLSFRTVSGQALVSIVPEGWWVCVNPGQEYSKEISPWELTTLRTTRGIEEVIEEIIQGEGIATLSLRPLNEHDFQGLRSMLVPYTLHQELFAAIEERGTDPIRLLLASHSIHSLPEVTQLIQRHLIGDIPLEVLDEKVNPVLFNAVRQFPLYPPQKRGWITRFAGLLKRK